MDAAARMLRSLDGLRVGDCFGQQFFTPGLWVAGHVDRREDPPGTWFYTDDTAQAAVLVEHLCRHGRVVQDDLATALAEEHTRDPRRGYGAGARTLLNSVAAGTPWHTASHGAFSGMGSMGNGAAMRVAPLGAFFAEDLAIAAREAAQSAEVSHANVNGIAGPVAVAVAAAALVQGRPAPDVWQAVLDLTPASMTRDIVARAAGLAPGSSTLHAAKVLGVGDLVCAHDTVPFSLWVALTFGARFEDALWEAVSMGGDRDTTCAIIGGMLAGVPGVAIPTAWEKSAERRFVSGAGAEG